MTRAAFIKLLILFMIFNNVDLIAVTTPNWMIKQQNFSKTNKVINSIFASTAELSTNAETIPFKVDNDLEKNPATAAEKCLQDFLYKGGVLQNVSNLSSATQPSLHLQVGDAVYPVCSGGWCRSQVLWAILQPYSHQIILFPPHAARAGWDPYNGQINRYRNYAQEIVPDEFSLYFGIEKALRFGFEHTAYWKLIEESPTTEGIKTISQFYDQYYFGSNSSWQGKQGKKRIYIAFSNNTHVTLHRLNQANDSLKEVTVMAINAEDTITSPPDFLNTFPRSTKAYKYFSKLLTQLFDFSELANTK